MATVIERIAQTLVRQPHGVPVGDLARQLGLTYQGVRNEIERSGARHGVVIDRSCSPAVARPVDAGRSVASDTVEQQRARQERWLTIDASRELDWEGNVQARVCRWLESQDWRLERVADTATRERGTDIVASRQGRRAHIEVKGWPSRSYADPSRRSENKPTEPTNQAAHWFAGAVVSGLRLRDAHPTDLIALAFPDRPRYRKLAAEIEESIRLLRLQLWFVGADEVDVWP